MLYPWRAWYFVFIVFSSSCDALEETHAQLPPHLIRDTGSLEQYWRAAAFRKIHFQEYEIDMFLRARELEMIEFSAPGSKPPKCDSKCGKCTPCTPIRVPVQPGPHKASEYYPEAWRCKCNGKLYMP